MDKHIGDYTLEELQALEPYRTEKPFRNIVIVPMNEIHDSGFRCMKFVLLDENVDICGVVYTGSDVIWPNGIGGYGKDLSIFDIPESKHGRLIPKLGLHLDCLPGSNCIRIMTDCDCTLDEFIGSDFIFYGEVKQ